MFDVAMVSILSLELRKRTKARRNKQEEKKGSKTQAKGQVKQKPREEQRTRKKNIQTENPNSKLAPQLPQQTLQG